MNKKVIEGVEALEEIACGINEVANAVGKTLGPCGRTALIDKEYSSPIFTKDGVTVAKSLSFKGTKALGARIAQNVASATVDAAGDGTTTAIVLLREIFERGLSLYRAGILPTDLRDGMRFGVSKVVQHLKSNAKQIALDSEKIKEVATISANGDTLVGDLIAKLINEVGKDGIITVEDGKSTDTTSEKVEGMKFDQGFKSTYFINNNQKQACELENVHILVYDKKLDSMQHAQKLVEILESIRHEPLLIIASDISDPVLPLLVINNAKQIIKVCAVKTPGFGDTSNSMAEDIAIFTGATYIAEAMGRTLENFQTDYLGKAKKIIVDSKSTTIISGNGDASMIRDRCNSLRSALANETSEYAKNKLEDRISKLTGKAGIIHVGGTTEAEQKELKDRVEDAVQAVKAAIIGGILPGGGSEYIRASKMLEAEIESMSKGKNKDKYSQGFVWGVDAIMNALAAPLRQSLINAGLVNEWQTIIAKIREEDDSKFGYDVALRKYCNMIASGIVDPAESAIAAITNAGHNAAMIIGSGCVVTNDPDSKDNQNNHGGMGGMGGY